MLVSLIKRFAFSLSILKKIMNNGMNTLENTRGKPCWNFFDTFRNSFSLNLLPVPVDFRGNDYASLYHLIVLSRLLDERLKVNIFVCICCWPILLFCFSLVLQKRRNIQKSQKCNCQEMSLRRAQAPSLSEKHCSVS